MKKKNRMRIPERRRGTGEYVGKREQLPKMIFASYGGGEPLIIIREGEKRQPHVISITASTPISNDSTCPATAV